MKKNFILAVFFALVSTATAPLYNMDTDQELDLSSILDKIKTEEINFSYPFDSSGPLAQAFSDLSSFQNNQRNLHRYLLAPQENPVIKTIFRQKSFIASFRKLSNGMLACGTAQGDIFIIDPINQQIVMTLKNHSGQIFSMIEFGHHQLLSASFDQKITLWNLDTGTPIVTFSGHTATVTTLAKIDEEHFASASFDGEIKIWSTLHGEIKSIAINGKKHDKSSKNPTVLESRLLLLTSINALVFLENGLLASASTNGFIDFWNIETGERTDHIEAHEHRINSLILLKNKRLASASADGTIKIWDPISKKAICTIFNKDEEDINSLIQLANGNIAARSGIFNIKIWSSTTGELLNNISCDDLFSAIEQLDDGNIVSASSYTKIFLCELYSPKTITWFEEAIKTSPKHIVLLTQLEKYREFSIIADVHYDWFRTLITAPIHYQSMYFRYLSTSIQ